MILKCNLVVVIKIKPVRPVQAVCIGGCIYNLLLMLVCWSGVEYIFFYQQTNRQLFNSFSSSSFSPSSSSSPSSSAPRFCMCGGLKSRCVGRVCGADGAGTICSIRPNQFQSLAYKRHVNNYFYLLQLTNTRFCRYSYLCS